MENETAPTPEIKNPPKEKKTWLEKNTQPFRSDEEKAYRQKSTRNGKG